MIKQQYEKIYNTTWIGCCWFVLKTISECLSSAKIEYLKQKMRARIMR